MISTGSNGCFMAAALLNSIARHASAEHHYHIYIVHDGISAASLYLLSSIIAGRDSLAFSYLAFDEERCFGPGGRSGVFKPSFWPPSVYCKLCVPQPFPLLQRILILDTDTIVCQDIAALWNEDMQGRALGVCPREYPPGYLEQNERFFHVRELAHYGTRTNYYRAALGLDINHMFETGVQLQDLRRTAPYLKDALGMIRRPLLYADLDVLNKLFAHDHLLLDPQYNAGPWQIAPYIQAHGHLPAIIHNMAVKPYRTLQGLGCALYYRYVQGTGFEHEALQRAIRLQLDMACSTLLKNIRPHIHAAAAKCLAAARHGSGSRPRPGAQAGSPAASACPCCRAGYIAPGAPQIAGCAWDLTWPVQSVKLQDYLICTVLMTIARISIMHITPPPTSPDLAELRRLRTAAEQLGILVLQGQQVYGGQRWERALSARLEDPRYLDGFGYKVFSQNDEDGIIEEIFRRIGTAGRRFIEFGVQTGLECNTHLLLMLGWHGLWLGGDERACAQIRRNFRTSLERGRLKLGCSFITRDNINELFAAHGFGGELDLLSVDIDGNDYHVLQAILKGRQIRPRVIVTEYNALIPPAADPDDRSSDWIMEYRADWHWRGDDCQGASLSAFYHLCRECGYSLVGTNTNGVNAFFVRSDLCGDHFVSDAQGARPFYSPLRFNNRRFGRPGHNGCIALNEAMEYRLQFYRAMDEARRRAAALAQTKWLSSA